MKNKIYFIPAIDIIEGKCVRLHQGDYNQKTAYNQDPEEMADLFVRSGVERIHIVDLDGAKRGMPVNHEKILQIADNHRDIAIEVGGGIRGEAAIAFYREKKNILPILGSRAISDPAFFETEYRKSEGKIILGLDVKNEMVAVHGWQKTSTIHVEEYIDNLSVRKIFPTIIFTDIATDGTLSGPALELTEKLTRKYADFSFILSGGISSLQDIQAAINLQSSNLLGIISGKAIYENRINIADAVKLCTN